MRGALPDWLDPSPWLGAQPCSAAAVEAALGAETLGPADFLALLSPQAQPYLEPMAQRAQALTRRSFGRTISLYAPLYLSNYCTSGCAYCGFASDREQPRRRLETEDLARELDAVAAMGFDEILLLTGERTPQAGFEYLRGCVSAAAERFSLVGIETFPLTTEEYRQLAGSGCTAVTVYQETYHPDAYARLHRWGPKRDFLWRLEAPSRALEAGMRTVGLGVLLGLADPIFDALCLWRHAWELQRRYWRSGLALSFPRLRPLAGGFPVPFSPPSPTDEGFLAQTIFAFRLAFPELPLLLSTREGPRFRDGMAGVGISKMSAASRTTVGGYAGAARCTGGQFPVTDERDADAFCAALRAQNLDPVFKSWDAVYRGGGA